MIHECFNVFICGQRPNPQYGVLGAVTRYIYIYTIMLNHVHLIMFIDTRC